MVHTRHSIFVHFLPRAVLFAALVLLVHPLATRAQTVPVEPYYAVTTGDDVPLKAGDMDGYYHVAMLERGRVVWVDAEGGGWARVAYPPDLPVYVRAEDVSAEDGGKAVVLTRESGLKSVNQAGGFGASWQRAMPRGEDAPIGTRLRVFSDIKDTNDKTIGYAVVPPRGARAYLKVGALRAATDAEVEAYLSSLPEAGDESDAAEAEPNDADSTGSDEPAAGDADQTDAADERDVPTAEPITEPPAATTEELDAGGRDIDLRDPDADASDTPAGEREQPAAADQATTDTDDGVTRITQGEADATARMIGTLRQLSDLFNQVQQQDSDTAELDEMAAELRRAIAAQGDDAVGQRITTSLGQRLQLIEMRISARDARRELRAKRESIDASFTEIATRIRELETTRGYQFVGRLVRSSVYDGNRLPLMYRIVSVNESVPRTIGYIVPSENELNMTARLGEIVGVLGTSTLDRDLNLRIVTPTRIDTLGPESLNAIGRGLHRSGS
ncbi:MAG: hypothetical protein Q9O74_06990 [Planctomycetota bacterium]|nr:hypothetical protein [Planctomycetota bacterium]